LVKRLSVYGDYETTKWVITKQRTLIQRRDGIWQRYWYKTKVKVTVEESRRYEFYGKGKDLYEAVRLAHPYMPRGYVEVDARDFIEDPEEYGVPGEWVWREVES
jgi:hypothetical protein